MKRLRLRRFSRKPADDPAPVAKAPDVETSTQQVGRKIRHAPGVSNPKPAGRPSRDPLVSGLTHRQGLFLRHYLECNNATEAARRAGYSVKTADRSGPRLLGNVVIAAEIQRRRAALVERLDITPQRIAEELARMGFANMQDFMAVGPNGSPVTDFSNLTREQAAALQEITVEEFTDGRSDKREVRRVKFKLADKANALMLLGKNLGMFAENHKHDHTHTLVGALMDEIDAAGRGKPRVIEGSVLPPRTDGE